MMGSTIAKLPQGADGYTRKQKDELIVYGFVKTNYTNEAVFPSALIDLCFLFYHIQYEILKWSTRYKSKGLQLTMDNTCIAEQSSNKSGYKYSLCDTDPVKSGKFCWRFEIFNPSRWWFSICVGQPGKAYPNEGTSKHGVYGVGTDPNWYPYIYAKGNRFRNTNNKHKGNWSHPSKIHSKYHIDMLFDADIGELQLCMLEKQDRLSIKIWGIPCNTDHGYVPHFNTINLTQCSVRIASIPVESYGEQIEDMFQSDQSV